MLCIYLDTFLYKKYTALLTMAISIPLLYEILIGLLGRASDWDNKFWMAMGLYGMGLNTEEVLTFFTFLSGIFFLFFW